MTRRRTLPSGLPQITLLIRIVLFCVFVLGYLVFVCRMNTAGVIAWSIPLLAFVTVIWCADQRQHLTRERLQNGQCAHCGYDLRASPGRCPECGAQVEREQ
jgi:hypothetical protein